MAGWGGAVLGEMVVGRKDSVGRGLVAVCVNRIRPPLPRSPPQVVHPPHSGLT